MTGTYRWEVAHERDGDDRDYAEHIDHVDRGRAVSRRCHIACTNLQINGRHQKCISFSALAVGGVRTDSCRFMRTADAIGKM